MNGLTVEVEKTDAEGRIILADALFYATTTFAPKNLVDVATLTGAIISALGDRLYGCAFQRATSFRKQSKAARTTLDSLDGACR